MTKAEFIKRIDSGLSGLPRRERDQSIDFYSEMIDDRMEDGFSEEEAVEAAGNVDEIISQIIAQTPISKLVKEKIKPKKRLTAFEIILLILGSPIWLSLLIAAFAVLLALYIAFWAVIISLWAVFVSCVCCGLAGITGGILFAVEGHAPSGIAIFGAGIAALGVSILLFFGCREISRGIIILTRKTAAGIKKLIIGKEKQQ